jgi:hypothetical protein
MLEAERLFLQRLAKYSSYAKQAVDSKVNIRRHNNGHVVLVVYAMECRPSNGFFKVTSLGISSNPELQESTISQLLSSDSALWTGASSCHPAYLVNSNKYKAKGLVRDTVGVEALLYMMQS